MRIPGISAFILAVVLVPAVSSAEMVLAPFAGTTFGGSGGEFGDESHLVYGGTVTFVGDSPFGLEFEGQYAPDYFGESGNNNVASLMGSVVFGAADDSRNLRFFANAGAGLLRTHVNDHDQFFNTDRNSFGVTLGGSVILGLSDQLGLKGDVKYFRGLIDDEPGSDVDLDLTGFNFWRASLGLALRL